MRISRDKLALVKTSILIWIIGLLILMPEDLIHLLAVLVHLIYESMAFAIEELLTHGLGLSKFQAQMIVFYSSLAIGILLAFWLTRRIPRIMAWVKASVQQGYVQMRGYFLDAWQAFHARWKLELLLAQAVGMTSLMAWILV
jgi:hypothetical protein